MNSDRRKRLRSVISIVQSCADEVDAIADEEETARDNMPENLQYSEKYEAIEEACDYMRDACNSLDEAIQHMESAIVQ